MSATHAAPGPPGLVIAPAPIERVLRPFREFARQEAAGGLVLLAATAIALVWANSPWAGAYDALWRSSRHCVVLRRNRVIGVAPPGDAPR